MTAVPFFLKRSEDAFTSNVTSTRERVHGLLRLEEDRLVVQWRRDRTTEHVGATEMSTDTTYEEVREVSLPLASVAGARVRRRWWAFWEGPRLVLRSADLRAFDTLAGAEGLRLGHPAELELRLRRKDALVAEEFSADLALAVAQLGEAERRDALGGPPEPPGLRSPDGGASPTS